MKVEFYRTTWGVTQPLEEFMGTLKARSFSGVEICPLFMTQTEQEAVSRLLAKHELKVICLIQSSGQSVAEHLHSLQEQIVHVLSLFRPQKFNVHGGKDCWSLAEAQAFYHGFAAIEKQFESQTFCHETHRGRYLCNPWQAYPILQQFPHLALTADLSHWVVAAERHLDADHDFDEVMALVRQRSSHVHCRPCSPQHIQLSHIDDPFYSDDVAAFKRYWTAILAEQQQRGAAVVTVDPEMGPAPYSPVKAHSHGALAQELEPLVDQLVAVVQDLVLQLG
ncbi:hypothetical protein HDV03_004668 [Kappamyces sp. JEL0829]|nr:hypothetical protein HDV03_004668 [Kappamyces sp. JEL0829]